MKDSIINRLNAFVEKEPRLYSMDFGCVTPLYFYRMLGDHYSMGEIKNALRLCSKES